MLKLLPPLNSEEIAVFANAVPCRVPEDVLELLRFCRGVEGLAAEVNFAGTTLWSGIEAALPHGLPIASDGYGNAWVLDLLPDSTVWGPVYFACHDAPVLLYQSDSLATFLRELIRMSGPPHTSTVDDVHEDRLFDVWSTNPGVKTHAECLSSGDSALAAFAGELGATFEFIDMRNAPVGFGFSWGRYDPKTVVRRAGTARIFAYQKRAALLDRLFKRSS